MSEEVFQMIKKMNINELKMQDRPSVFAAIGRIENIQSAYYGQ